MIFQDVLTSGDIDDPGKLPIIFLKDVPFSELECLVKYMYTGKVTLPEGLTLTDFTRLATSMGISGKHPLYCNDKKFPIICYFIITLRAVTRKDA